ncbi:MAG: glycosyltransferase family 2 protein [Candidatus Shapirobacteria bacterium]|nr:glycosyltransferase family 2 protein [Candidatus Shapirobacteria bacterium]MDD3002459.1 glycosyltransferase family 2 protein [Candidatus Shapirobacteria bacterium]MDD4383352.1 glycosyltransferase family 2 protein [Candidatus Shapirobacteria bacterium]
MNISIIIVTWNTAKITQKCVQTINKFLDNPEIIIVDNGSEDNTVELLSQEKNVKIIKNGANLGFSKANNIGFKQATNEYILFMNSDIELIDDSINNLFKYFKDKNNIGIIGPKFLNPDLTPQASVFPKQSALNAFKEFFLNQKNSYSKYTPKTDNPIKVWAVSGGCILTRKSFFKSIGGWNEKYFFYFEDLDLCRKINKIGKDVIYFPKCQIIHRHGVSGAKLADSSNQWRRLIPGSKKYHGLFKHYLINSILWSGQKWQNIKK